MPDLESFTDGVYDSFERENQTLLRKAIGGEAGAIEQLVTRVAGSGSTLGSGLIEEAVFAAEILATLAAPTSAYPQNVFTDTDFVFNETTGALDYSGSGGTYRISYTGMVSRTPANEAVINLAIGVNDDVLGVYPGDPPSDLSQALLEIPTGFTAGIPMTTTRDVALETGDTVQLFCACNTAAGTENLQALAVQVRTQRIPTASE